MEDLSTSRSKVEKCYYVKLPHSLEMTNDKAKEMNVVNLNDLNFD
jgi:hypothetical protein